MSPLYGSISDIEDINMNLYWHQNKYFWAINYSYSQSLAGQVLEIIDFQPNQKANTTDKC